MVSQYAGSGELGFFLAQADEQARIRRKWETAMLKRQIKALKEQTKKIRAVQHNIQELKAAVLLINGYHTHKGQWRKRREQ